ncbi:uncharacterized protein TNCV_4523631 [Trichonephila clavipes]|nr:uncharacterized protein TNCV_4523631 [Trichonephila clavipes]
MIPILRRLNDPFYIVIVHYKTFPVFLTQYVLNCPDLTEIELLGRKQNEGIVEVEFIRLPEGFIFMRDFERDFYENGCAFVSKYITEENKGYLTHVVFLDMVISPFIRQFPILNMYIDENCIQIRTSRVNNVRCLEHFSTLGYLEMKHTRNPRSEGKRVFRSLMDLPPLCYLEENNIQVKSDLSSDNMREEDSSEDNMASVDALLLSELQCFSTQTQVFELSTRHGIRLSLHEGIRVKSCFQRLPDACLLTRGLPYNKGITLDGTYKYLNTCTFIVVPNTKIVYRTSAKHWLSLLRRLDAERVTAFSDIRAVFQKCGIVAYFFNWIRVVQEQLPLQNSVHMKNIMTILKYQCRTGRPLPLTRDGLAKNPERSPLEILSFEAWKRNCAHMCIEAPSVPVTRSTEKMFLVNNFGKERDTTFA